MWRVARLSIRRSRRLCLGKTRHAVLLHGLGRSSLSLQILAWRLRRHGFTTHCFDYFPLFETFDGCLARLQRFIAQRTQGAPVILVGHSLGTVLARAALPVVAPQACFFLAPPTVACRWARLLQRLWFFRWRAGEMGQKLADPAFMAALPIPTMPTVIFAGTKGVRWRWWPCAAEVNDGILMLSETHLLDVPRTLVAASHTFIMNHRLVAEVIAHASSAE